MSGEWWFVIGTAHGMVQMLALPAVLAGVGTKEGNEMTHDLTKAAALVTRYHAAGGEKPWAGWHFNQNGLWFNSGRDPAEANDQDLASLCDLMASVIGERPGCYYVVDSKDGGALLRQVSSTYRERYPTRLAALTTGFTLAIERMETKA